MAHFVHVFIQPKTEKSRNDVEKVLNRAKDWFRYGPGLYVLYTNSSTATWKERLIDLVKPGGNLFIVKIEMQERKGFMSDQFWEWIRKNLDA